MNGVAGDWAPTHVGFLRSINVPGRRLKMAELVAALEPLGLGEIRTFQATGNVLLATDRTSDELEETIPVALEQQLEIAVPCVVRTADEVRAVAGGGVFSDDEITVTAGNVEVLFVRDEPDERTLAAVLEYSTDDDPLVFRDGVLWWLPRQGVSDSSLPMRRLEQLLGVCTMRGHRAVAKLAAKHLT